MVRRFHLRGAHVALSFAAAFLSPVVVAQSGSSPAAASAQSTTLEARLQRQEDTEAIRRLLREYGKRLDAGDLQGYARLFAADGEWIGGFGSVKGRDRIAPFMEKNMSGPPPWESQASASAPPKPGPRGVHLMTNEIIEVNGDRATAWSKWTYMARNADNRPFAVMVGHYDDVLVRENGEWQFLRRVVSGDIPFSEAPTKK